MTYEKFLSAWNALSENEKANWLFEFELEAVPAEDAQQIWTDILNEIDFVRADNAHQAKTWERYEP